MWIVKDGNGGDTVLAACQQLDADGQPQPNQEQVADDDPRVEAFSASQESKPRVTNEEILDAMGSTTKTSALKAKYAEK